MYQWNHIGRNFLFRFPVTLYVWLSWISNMTLFLIFGNCHKYMYFIKLQLQSRKTYSYFALFVKINKICFNWHFLYLLIYNSISVKAKTQNIWYIKSTTAYSCQYVLLFFIIDISIIWQGKNVSGSIVEIDRNSFQELRLSHCHFFVSCKYCCWRKNW